MTAEERAADILRRCWWDADRHPGETHPGFKGLDKEIVEAIEAAIEAAASEERDAHAELRAAAVDAVETYEAGGAHGGPIQRLRAAVRALHSRGVPTSEADADGAAGVEAEPNAL